MERQAPTFESILEEYEAYLYQDVWGGGKRIKRGQRECVFRYQVVKEFFMQYKRPVKVLDIGANLGYFSLRLAEEFPGTYTLCEAGKVEGFLLAKLFEMNKKNSFVHIARRVKLTDLMLLAQREHFDVVLALSVLHHFDEPYQRVLDVMTQLGSHLLLEVPRPGEGLFQGERVDREPLDFSRYSSRLLTQTCYTHSADDRHAVLRDLHAIDCGNKVLATLGQDGRLSSVLTACDFKQSLLYYPECNLEKKAPCGPSLATYFALNGVYPRPKEILVKLKEFSLDGLNTFSPWDLYFEHGQLVHHGNPLSEYRDVQSEHKRVINSLENALK